MKRLLVPIDLSPTSEKALHFAAGIAAKTGGNIVAFHLISLETE